MGSQALEILRQGVWASATGGWFYDPHQSLFCNTIHLYVWLLLLCLPFTIYLYFPPSVAGWCAYCSAVALLFVAIKTLNLALHRMYDTSECIVVPPPPAPPPDDSTSDKRRPRKSDGETEGIELQTMGGGASSARAPSDDESVESIDFRKPDRAAAAEASAADRTYRVADLKVDVHRKHGSESSGEEEACAAAPSTSSSVVAPKGCARATQAGAAGGQRRRPKRARPPSDVEEDPSKRSAVGHFAGVDRANVASSASPYNPPRYFSVYPVDRFVTSTSSARPSTSRPCRTIARRNSNSIALQSQAGASRQLGFLSTGSVELGAYMMEKGDAGDDDEREGNVQSDGKIRNSVRRIKSAALEIGCPPPSVSNLSPHPNSVETIGGQPSKNPKYAVLPPPSKSLMKSLMNPHLNLWPNAAGGSAEGGDAPPYANYGSEIVYPIAEISDEMQTSQGQESDLESLSTHCGSDYEEENPLGGRQQLRGFDAESNRPLDVNSSDTEYENNGSRSPLLDKTDFFNDITIVKRQHEKSKVDKKRQNVKGLLHKNNSFSADSHNCDKIRGDRNRVLSKNNSLTSFVDMSVFVGEEENSNNYASNEMDDDKKSQRADEVVVNKRKQKCIKAKSSEPSDRFDKTSADSKDFLLEKSSVDSDDRLSNNQNFIVADSRKETANFEKDIKKSNELEVSNSSGSLEMQDARQDVTFEVSDVSNRKTLHSNSKDAASSSEGIEQKIQSDENSLFGITWLFEEINSKVEPEDNNECNDSNMSTDCNSPDDRPSTSNADVGVVSQKNLGAIPKQFKNINRIRASSLKENKKKDKSKDKDTWDVPTQEELETAEAHTALVHGLECLFAATKTNTVVMPPLTREERPRSYRDQLRERDKHLRESHKPKKKSIEEMAQTSTNTILPTSMPLLAAFLNSNSQISNYVNPIEPEAGPSCSDNMTPSDGPSYEATILKRGRHLKRASRRTIDGRPQYAGKRMKPENSFDSTNSSNNVHFATSFEDTSDGAIHCFLDEYGQWMSYTFDKNSSGHAKETNKLTHVKPAESQVDTTGANENYGSIASSLAEDVDISNKIKTVDDTDQTATNGSNCNSPSNEGSNNPLLSSNDNSTSLLPAASSGNFKNKTVYVVDTLNSTQQRSTSSIINQYADMRMMYTSANFFNAAACLPSEASTSNMLHLPIPISSSVGDNSIDISLNRNKSKLMDSSENTTDSQPNTYYNFKIFKCFQVKITVDRLRLMALFDRNLTIKETLLSIILGIMVSMLGALVLHLEFYKDICAFWFCFVMAGSQYSLLKSVQPDSASPVHGFNRMIAFSRPVYFCLYSAILCLIHYNIEQHPETDESDFTLYGMHINSHEILLVMQDVVSTFLLFFPLAFSFGLFPQVNTFTMYLLEQIDMHIFGGNATASLSAAFYCIFRSSLAIAFVYGFAYGGLTESKGSQHILFSIFCGLIVPIAYHLSRCASDYIMVWNILKSHLIPIDMYPVNGNDSASNADSEKQGAHLESDKMSKNKHDSESNISKQPSIGSSISKINISSETNISKSQKRSQTSVNSSVNSLKTDSKAGINLHSSGSLKIDMPPEDNKNDIKAKLSDDANEDEMEDPLPKKLQETVNSRFKNDIIVCSFMAVFIFGIHCTTVFSTLQPELNPIMWSIAGSLGWILHYLVPQLRKQLPWLWFSSPALKAREYAEFEVREPAKVMWFEKAYVYLCFLERNILYPIVFISAITEDSQQIISKFGPSLGVLIICICALKTLRNAYSDPDSQYLVLLFAALLFGSDFKWASETFLIDYFVMSIIFNKTYEFLLKIQFVVTYIAPWQITWGSAFHAFAQPFSVPHSAMLFLQAAISAVLSTPLNPILGSAIFISSYVRPVKFWERDYNTKRVDQSNTRLSSQLERNLGSDDNNLNSIFYEHLTRSLQHYLCGDLLLGRWGQVQQGDCFVLASDNLNCLVHIVEMGNGLVSFQLRGLEFRGTYCQQREVEAITEGPEDNDGCCCCAVGHLPNMLSVNAMFSLRWLAWQLTTARYVLEGYSISDNSAVSVLQVFEFRKVLITYYVKSIIFYTIQNPKLEEWLSSSSILEALKPTLDRNFIDLDPVFTLYIDEDYDYRASGITRASFCSVYHAWISHCGMKRDDLYKAKGDKLIARDSPLVSLCFGLSLVGRRTLGTASHNIVSSVEFFLCGLHALFKGDFRITCVRDEWIFSDMSLLHSVLAPAVRMALKLHQDHFMSPEEYCNCSALYSAISNHVANLVICHEASPIWRNNVLRGAPHLLALRHVMDDGSDEYKIIMLNKRYLTFRVIKLNRECVRGLWAGQQQELIYLRNRNPERGSIQNAKQALRNIINSSCDQPIGYPIYVSPLTTSYAETNPQLTSLIGGALSLGVIKKHAIGLWRKMRRRCGEGCSSGSGSNTIECGNNITSTYLSQTPHHTLDLSRTSLAGTRGSLASVGKPGSSTLASLAGLLSSREQPLAPASLQASIDFTLGGQKLFLQESDSVYSNMRESADKLNLTTERESRNSSRRGSWRHGSGPSHYPREQRQNLSIRDKGREGARRSKRDKDRDRMRPSSFRLQGAQEKDRSKPSNSMNDGYEMNTFKVEKLKERSLSKEKSRESKKDPRGSSSKMAGAAPCVLTPESSFEDLTTNASGDNCQIIINKNINSKHSTSFDQPKESRKRRSSDFACNANLIGKHHTSEKNIDNLACRDATLKNVESCSEHSVLKKSDENPRELAKTSKDLRFERESYRELTGKYSELSIKESGLRIAGDPKERIPIVKRSESLKSELKNHVSVGCKVVIVDPAGVYDCINLGRRIDVTWPSAYQRQRGGRNSWGTWVPHQGMDGQVVHKWTPFHRDPNLRSHVDKTILLVQIDDKFVPIAENCVQDLGDEV